jgi:hypothetical protein
VQLNISNLVKSAWVSLVLPHQSLGEMATKDELGAETMPPPSDPVFNVGDIVVLKYSSYNIGEQYRVEQSFADDGEGPTWYRLIPELAKYRFIIRTGDVLAHASTDVSVNTGAEVPSLCPQEPEAKRLLVRVFKIEDLGPSDIVKTVLYALGVEPKKGDKLLFYEYHKAGLGANFEHLAEDGNRLYGRFLPVRSLAEANRLDGRVDRQSPPVHDDKKELHKRMRFGALSLLHGMHDRSKPSEPLLVRLQTLGISKKTDKSCGGLGYFPMSGPPEWKAKQNPSTTASRAASHEQSNKIEIGNFVEVKRHGEKPYKGILTRKIQLRGTQAGHLGLPEGLKNVEDEKHKLLEQVEVQKLNAAARENKAQKQRLRGNLVPSSYNSDITNGKSSAPNTVYGVGDIVKIRRSATYLFGQIQEYISDSRFSVDTGDGVGLWARDSATLVMKAQPAEPKRRAMAVETKSTEEEDEAPPAEPKCSTMSVVTKSTEEEDEAPSAEPKLSAMAVETTRTKDANEEEEDEDDLVFVGRGAWKSRSHVSQDQCTFS